MPKNRTPAQIAEAMHIADVELLEAEREGNVSGQITALRERAQLWRQYAAYLAAAGVENYPAILSAQRDDISAATLATEAL